MIVQSFLKTKSPASHHLETFNTFVTYGIQDILDKEPDVILSDEHYITIDKAEVSPPEVLPAEARLKNLNYESAVFATVTEMRDGRAVTGPQKLQIGRIPTMVRSNKCRLHGTDPALSPTYGECEYDPGGYFILKGNERVLVTQVRGSYNIPAVFDHSKHTYVCRVRSMSEKTCHSSLTEMYIAQSGTVHVQFGNFKKGMSVEYEHLIRFLTATMDDADIKSLFKYPASNILSGAFPHMGLNPRVEEVVYYLEYMKSILQRTFEGSREPDNIDDIDNKRFEASGVLCYDLFHKLYKRFLGQVKTNYKKTGNAVESVKNATMITKGMLKSFLGERWGAVKTLYTRPGVSQLLGRLSYCDTLSHLRRISIPIEKGSKTVKVRYVNSSQCIFICPVETPEGQSVGIVLNMAISACVSERRCTTLTRQTVASACKTVDKDVKKKR